MTGGTETAAASLPPLRDVIRDLGLSADKRLGQNFLLDLNLTGRIARSAGEVSQGTIIEIGPGPGGLTRALLDHGTDRLIAIEQDARFLPALDRIGAAFPGRLQTIEGDARAIATATLGAAPRRIVANLPYNAATPLLIGWLRDLAADPNAYAGLVLMFQKEVADRIVAAPRGKGYGRLSVICQWLCKTERLFDVHRSAFVPPPDVTSTVVRLIPRPQPLAPAEMTHLEAVTRAAFGQRRKTLRRSLSQLGDAATFCELAGVDPGKRAEEIDIDRFCALARAVSAQSVKMASSPR